MMSLGDVTRTGPDLATLGRCLEALGSGEAGGHIMASYKSELETRDGRSGFPSLEDMEMGRPIGAILPMSEQRQLVVRDSIEVIDYLLNQESVIVN